MCFYSTGMNITVPLDNIEAVLSNFSNKGPSFQSEWREVLCDCYGGF